MLLRLRYSYGGVLRNKRIGRGQRQLFMRDPIQVVFKVNKAMLPIKIDDEGFQDAFGRS